MELDFRSELFSAGSCRTCMCPWAHEGSGNAAELEEQPLRPLFLLLFPPFLCLRAQLRVEQTPCAQPSHPHPPGPLACWDGVQGGPDGIIRNFCSLTCSCSQKGEPNHELQGPQRQQGRDRVSQPPLPIRGWSGQPHHHPPVANTLLCPAQWTNTAPQPQLGFSVALSITRRMPSRSSGSGMLSITHAGALWPKQLPAQPRRCLAQLRHLGVSHQPCPIPNVPPHWPPSSPATRGGLGDGGCHGWRICPAPAAAAAFWGRASLHGTGGSSGGWGTEILIGVFTAPASPAVFTLRR